MAGSSVFMSWNRSSGSDPADFADNSILAGGIFLFCKSKDIGISLLPTMNYMLHTVSGLQSIWKRFINP